MLHRRIYSRLVGRNLKQEAFGKALVHVTQIVVAVRPAGPVNFCKDRACLFTHCGEESSPRLIYRIGVFFELAVEIGDKRGILRVEEGRLLDLVAHFDTWWVARVRGLDLRGY